MKPTNIVTIILIAFIAVSIAVFVKNETSTTPKVEANSDDQNAIKTETPVVNTTETINGVAIPSENQTVSEEVTTQNKPANVKIIAYYFHANKRCSSCIRIENLSHDAIHNGFPDAIKSGKLVWKLVNVDEKVNEHFVKDFQLTTRSVVLVKMVDGKQSDWKNLTKVWDLLGDKDAFTKYIQDEVSAFLTSE